MFQICFKYVFLSSRRMLSQTSSHVLKSIVNLSRFLQTLQVFTRVATYSPTVASPQVPLDSNDLGIFSWCSDYRRSMGTPPIPPCAQW